MSKASETNKKTGRVRLTPELLKRCLNEGMVSYYGLMKSDPEAALEHLRRAAAYQRRHVFYREQLGIQLRQMGRDREALEVFRQNTEDGVASDISALNIRALERKLARETPAAPAP